MAESWRAVEVIGAPSSAGAFSHGQEDAPAAFRRAGIVEQLRESSLSVIDGGDLPVQRWRPDRTSPHAQNVEQVVANAAGVRDHVLAAGKAGRRALVLGGDCTTGVGTLAGVIGANQRPPAWIYFDLHADLNTTTSVRDGALDWTGVAHALGLPDTIATLRRLGGSVPLISPERVLLFSHDPAEATSWEREQIERLGLWSVSHETVGSDPAEAAESALGRVHAHAPILIHFDADAVNFTDAPLSENTGRGSGITLDAALAALHALLADQRVRALTITEVNPHHASADPAALPRLTTGLARALAG